jgi:uncharacterized protein
VETVVPALTLGPEIDMKVVLAILILATGLGFGGAARADFQDGLKAAQSGDFATALREWRSLAEQGLANAQYNLGLTYGNGRGVLQDDREAVKWWRKAAEQGNAIAQMNLGANYARGEGVPQDFIRAASYGVKGKRRATSSAW